MYILITIGAAFLGMAIGCVIEFRTNNFSPFSIIYRMVSGVLFFLLAMFCFYLVSILPPQPYAF